MSPSLSSVKSLLILSLLYVSTLVGDAGLNKKPGGTKNKPNHKLKVHLGPGSVHGGVGIHGMGVGLHVGVNVNMKKKNKKEGKKKKGKAGLDEIVPIDGDNHANPKIPDPLPKDGQNHATPKISEPLPNDGKHHATPKIPEPLPNKEVPVGPGVVAPTNFLGAWEIVCPNAGVSAMHIQLMPNNKAIMFDATSLGRSEIELPPNNCRVDAKGFVDCFAHSVEYDTDTNKVRVLKVQTDPWCSSGGLAPDGTLVGTGGWNDGERTIRYINACDNCDWRESNIHLSDMRWYATHVLLSDGRFVVIGGRRAFNYEFLAPEGQPSPGIIDLPFLRETTDMWENNLYPFVHLTPDGNLFIFANHRAILFDVRTNRIVRNYPDLPGGSRNYPGSGCSAIVTMDLRAKNKEYIDMEVLICGGADPTAFTLAEKNNTFLVALDTCGRMKVMDPNAQWEIEKMPTPRVMGDMLNLPNGDILILSGGKKGASGWQFGDDPNLTPLLYTPGKPVGQRFKELAPTQIPRMYHSSSAVLPDGRILVAGSNTNPSYQFHVKFPTELRVEKFSPPYLDNALANLRPVLNKKVPKSIGYDLWFDIEFKLNAPGIVRLEDLMVTMYQPPFTTHGYSMNQRLLSLPIKDLAPNPSHGYTLKVQAPATSSLAPPGHHILFLNHQGVPSVGAWIQLK